MECFVSVKCASQCQYGYLLADGSIIYFCFQYDAVDLYLNLKVPNSRVFALAEKQLHVKCYYYHLNSDCWFIITIPGDLTQRI